MLTWTSRHCLRFSLWNTRLDDTIGLCNEDGYSGNWCVQVLQEAGPQGSYKHCDFGEEC